MKHLSRTLLLTAIAAVSANNMASASDFKYDFKYPGAPTDSTVVDNYFGIEVRDLYRPLEDDNSPVVAEWVEAENKLTRSYLDTISNRQELRDRLMSLQNYPKQGMPWLGNDGKYYFTKNEGLKNQSVYYRVKKLGDEPELFLDPNTLSEDGTVALKGLFPSPTGKYTAYTISRSGSDWSEIYLMDTKTKKLLPDHIVWAKFTGATWSPDGKGFYYSAYPRPEEGREYSNANEYHSIYYHKIGDDQSKDVLVYTNPDEPLRFHSPIMFENSPYLFVSGAGQGNGNSLMYADTRKPNLEWVVIEPGQDYLLAPIAIIKDKLYLQTTRNAPLGKLVSVPLKDMKVENFKDVIAPTDAVLASVDQVGKDRFCVLYEKDACNHVEITDLEGNKINEVELPGYGAVWVSASDKTPQLFYSFSSFTTPYDTYLYDARTNKSELFHRNVVADFNPDDYVAEQVFYTSKDGTRVPMFITYKKGLKRDGNNPVYLYGYGGFNVSLLPYFSSSRLVWLENGGIFVQTNLRGGSEYGEEWHEAGTKMKKQNVFDDFIAAAEYMINEGWSSPEKMVIEGGSNGGLLVGAVTNMRPDLFRVAIPRVGVMDMMRYHLFTVGWNWAPDYGTSADSKEMAQYLLNYSPIHNISNDGTRYPAILVTTADHDDRVVPAHSFKYAAALQAADTGDAPKLIRIDTKAGHGAGKPISKIIDEWVDIYSFIFNNLKNDAKK